jgi:hypothetical protein
VLLILMVVVGGLSAVFHKFGDVFYPTPTLTLPLKGRGISAFLPLQGGGQKGDGVSVGVRRSGIVFMKGTTKVKNRPLRDENIKPHAGFQKTTRGEVMMFRKGGLVQGLLIGGSEWFLEASQLDAILPKQKERR